MSSLFEVLGGILRNIGCVLDRLDVKVLQQEFVGVDAQAVSCLYMASVLRRSDFVVPVKKSFEYPERSLHGIDIKIAKASAQLIRRCIWIMCIRRSKIRPEDSMPAIISANELVLVSAGEEQTSNDSPDGNIASTGYD